MQGWLVVVGTVLLVEGIVLLEEGTVQPGDTVSQLGIRLALGMRH